MKKHRMPVCLSNMLTVLCVLVMLLVGLVPAEQVDAYSVEVSYYIDGLDLDLGTVELDPTVVVILMGEHIERILEPSIEKLNDFQPSVDIGLSFHPEDEEQLRLVLQNETQVAVVDAGLNFDALNDDLLGGLEFKSGDVTLPVTLGTLLVLKTDEGEYYKLRFEELAGFAVNIDYAELGKGNGNPGTVPEPSTFLLLGLGLLGVIHMMKRKKGMKSLLPLLLAGLMFGSPAAFAQEDVITITKAGSTGDGAIVYGEYRCEPGCTEFTIPYSEGMGTVLKAIPDEDSRFIRWRKEDNTPLQGEFQVEPGETLKVLFQDKRELFTDVPGAETPELSPSKRIRGRYVQIFSELFFEEEVIVFNLFENVSFTFVREELRKDELHPSADDMMQDYIWIGETSEEEWWTGAVVVFSKDGMVSGTIIDAGKMYSIKRQNGSPVVFEIDESAVPPVLDINVDEWNESSRRESPRSSFRNFASKVLEWLWALVVGDEVYAQTSVPPIDIMVLYTQNAKQSAGRFLIGKQIKEAVEYTNAQVLKKSRIDGRLRLVYFGELDYWENGDMKIELKRLVNMQSVQELRDRFQADVVFLVTTTEPASGWAGAALVMNDVGPAFEKDAFAIVRTDHLIESYTMAHELGHLLAARHERANNAQPMPGPFSYNYGYVFFDDVNHKNMKTVMAIDKPSTPRANIFSDPERRHPNGFYMGVPEGEPKAADNRKTLNTTWATVAAFRPKPTPTPTPTPTPNPDVVTIQRFYLFVDDWALLYAMKSTGELRFLNYAHSFDKKLDFPFEQTVTIQADEELYILAFSDLRKAQFFNIRKSVINAKSFSERATARLFKVCKLGEPVPADLCSNDNDFDRVRWHFPDSVLRRLAQQAESPLSEWKAVEVTSKIRFGNAYYYFWFSGRHIPCEYPYTHCFDSHVWEHDDQLYLFKLDKAQLR